MRAYGSEVAAAELGAAHGRGGGRGRRRHKRRGGERRARAGRRDDVGTRESASRPLVCFGELIDTTIKGLTILFEYMSRN